MHAATSSTSSHSLLPGLNGEREHPTLGGQVSGSAQEDRTHSLPRSDVASNGNASIPMMPATNQNMIAQSVIHANPESNHEVVNAPRPVVGAVQQRNFVPEPKRDQVIINQIAERRRTPIYKEVYDFVQMQYDTRLKIAPQNKPVHMTECPICLGDLANGEITRTNCQHTFHDECLRKWIGTSPTCPVCKNALAKNMYDHVAPHIAELDRAMRICGEKLPFETMSTMPIRVVDGVCGEIWSLPSNEDCGRYAEIFEKIFERNDPRKVLMKYIKHNATNLPYEEFLDCLVDIVTEHRLSTTKPAKLVADNDDSFYHGMTKVIDLTTELVAEQSCLFYYPTQRISGSITRTVRHAFFYLKKRECCTQCQGTAKAAYMRYGKKSKSSAKSVLGSIPNIEFYNPVKKLGVKGENAVKRSNTAWVDTIYDQDIKNRNKHEYWVIDELLLNSKPHTIIYMSARLDHSHCSLLPFVLSFGKARDVAIWAAAQKLKDTADAAAYYMVIIHNLKEKLALAEARTALSTDGKGKKLDEKKADSLFAQYIHILDLLEKGSNTGIWPTIADLKELYAWIECAEYGKDGRMRVVIEKVRDTMHVHVFITRPKMALVTAFCFLTALRDWDGDQVKKTGSVLPANDNPIKKMLIMFSKTLQAIECEADAKAATKNFADIQACNAVMYYYGLANWVFVYVKTNGATITSVLTNTPAIPIAHTDDHYYYPASNTIVETADTVKHIEPRYLYKATSSMVIATVNNSGVQLSADAKKQTIFKTEDALIEEFKSRVYPMMSTFNRIPSSLLCSHTPITPNIKAFPFNYEYGANFSKNVFPALLRYMQVPAGTVQTCTEFLKEGIISLKNGDFLRHAQRDLKGHPGLRTITNFYYANATHLLTRDMPKDNGILVDIGAKAAQTASYMPDGHGIKLVAYRPIDNEYDHTYYRQLSRKTKITPEQIKNGVKNFLYSESGVQVEAKVERVNKQTVSEKKKSNGVLCVDAIYYPGVIEYLTQEVLAGSQVIVVMQAYAIPTSRQSRSTNYYDDEGTFNITYNKEWRVVSKPRGNEHTYQHAVFPIKPSERGCPVIYGLAFEILHAVKTSNCSSCMMIRLRIPEGPNAHVSDPLTSALEDEMRNYLIRSSNVVENFAKGTATAAEQSKYIRNLAAVMARDYKSNVVGADELQNLAAKTLRSETYTNQVMVFRDTIEKINKEHNIRIQADDEGWNAEAPMFETKTTEIMEAIMEKEHRMYQHYNKTISIWELENWNYIVLPSTIAELSQDGLNYAKIYYLIVILICIGLITAEAGWALVLWFIGCTWVFKYLLTHRICLVPRYVKESQKTFNSISLALAEKAPNDLCRKHYLEMARAGFFYRRIDRNMQLNMEQHDTPVRGAGELATNAWNYCLYLLAIITPNNLKTNVLNTRPRMAICTLLIVALLAQYPIKQERSCEGWSCRWRGTQYDRTPIYKVLTQRIQAVGQTINTQVEAYTRYYTVTEEEVYCPLYICFYTATRTKRRNITPLETFKVYVSGATSALNDAAKTWAMQVQTSISNTNIEGAIRRAERWAGLDQIVHLSDSEFKPRTINAHVNPSAGILEDSIMRLLNKTEESTERAMDKLMKRLSAMERGQDKVARTIHRMSKRPQLSTPDEIRDYIKGLHDHEAFEISVLLNWLGDVTGVSDALAPYIAIAITVLTWTIYVSCVVITLILHKQILQALYIVTSWTSNVAAFSKAALDWLNKKETVIGLDPIQSQAVPRRIFKNGAPKQNQKIGWNVDHIDKEAKRKKYGPKRHKLVLKPGKPTKINGLVVYGSQEKARPTEAKLIMYPHLLPILMLKKAEEYIPKVMLEKAIRAKTAITIERIPNQQAVIITAVKQPDAKERLEYQLRKELDASDAAHVACMLSDESVFEKHEIEEIIANPKERQERVCEALELLDSETAPAKQRSFNEILADAQKAWDNMKHDGESRSESKDTDDDGFGDEDEEEEDKNEEIDYDRKERFVKAVKKKEIYEGLWRRRVNGEWISVEYFYGRNGKLMEYHDERAEEWDDYLKTDLYSHNNDWNTVEGIRVYNYYYYDENEEKVHVNNSVCGTLSKPDKGPEAPFKFYPYAAEKKRPYLSPYVKIERCFNRNGTEITLEDLIQSLQKELRELPEESLQHNPGYEMPEGCQPKQVIPHELTLLETVIHRHGGHLVHASVGGRDVIRQKFRCQAKVWADKVSKIRDDPKSFAEYLAGVDGAQKQKEYQLAYDKAMETNYVDNSLTGELKKNENLFVPEDDVRGRIIWAPAFAYRAAVGYLVDDYLHRFKQIEKGFCHGADFGAIADKITKMVRKIQNPVFISIDGSAHDSSQTAQWKEAVDDFLLEEHLEWFGSKVGWTVAFMESIKKAITEKVAKFKLNYFKGRQKMV